MNKTKEKYVEKKEAKKDLDFIEKPQEGRDAIEQHIRER